MKNNFRASIESVNFGRKDVAVKRINDWAANKTRNLIPELVSGSSINEDTKLILTNAIYFKSKWKQPFREEDTSPGRFKKSTGEFIDVDFMQIEASLLSVRPKDVKGTFLILPYVDERFQMLVFHPDSGSTIESLERYLSSSESKVEELRAQAKSEPTMLKMPKFEAEFSTSLVRACQQMGVNDIFTDRANFR